MSTTIDQPEYQSWGIEALLPGNDKLEARDKWNAFRNLFTVAQSAAVREYLKYIASHSSPESAEAHLAEGALQRFWS